MRIAAKVAIGYVIIAGLWILLSDRALGAFVSDPIEFEKWSTYKGWFFVVVTGAMLYGVLARELYKAAVESNRRSEAELALRESEARFRLIADTINEIFWIQDPVNDRFLYVSPGYERIMGRPAAMLFASSRAWLDSVVPEDRERIQKMIPSRESGDGQEIEFRITHPNGTIRWIQARTFPVKDSSGAVIRVVGIAQDVSARKRLEQQFLRAQRLESIGTLAGGVAHDLNNILAPILMGSSMLKSDAADTEERKIVEMIQTAAQRGAGIIKQLLTFSRGMEGQKTLVQVRHILKETLAIIRETFPRNVTFDMDVPADLWPVHADATLLHQVFMNLCVNARDAMPDGGELTLTARNATIGEADIQGGGTAAPGPYVVVSVRDTGEGIPRENMDQIFDPFFTTKVQGRGTGLGLATVLGIVKSHDGFVTVESELGRGSCFRIHLPGIPDPRADGTEEAAIAPAVAGQGEQILVVDDEESILATTRRALERSNFRVHTARNGEEAMGLFLDNRGGIKVVVTDLIMPVMDGLALIRAIRSVDREVPIVATSGFSDADRTAELEQLGVRVILDKPHPAPVLSQAVAAALGRRDAAGT